MKVLVLFDVAYRTATVTIILPVVVSVSPTTAEVVAGGDQQFNATVSGTTNQAVTWTVTGKGCTGLSCGTITSTGFYGAPGAAPSPAQHVRPLAHRKDRQPSLRLARLKRAKPWRRPSPKLPRLVHESLCSLRLTAIAVSLSTLPQRPRQTHPSWQKICRLLNWQSSKVRPPSKATASRSRCITAAPGG